MSSQPSPRPPIHPNVITAGRLPLAPIAVACMVQGTTTGYAAAFALSILLEITDIADGQIARRYGVVTRFGKLFDPFSDAFSRFIMFLGFHALGVAELWMIIVIFARDSSISFFRSVAVTVGGEVAARTSGKAKAVVQGLGTQLILLCYVLQAAWPDIGVPAWLPSATMWVITLVTLGSFVDYFIGYLPILREAWNDDLDGAT